MLYWELTFLTVYRSLRKTEQVMGSELTKFDL